MSDTKERQKLIWQNMIYSIQRIDLLIISVSGAGIYLCLETLKFMYTNKMTIGGTLKVSAGFFVAAIVINFLSQFLSYQSNLNEYLYCSEIEKADQDDDCKKRASRFDYKAELLEKLTNYSNWMSAIAMFVGLILSFAYFITNF